MTEKKKVRPHFSAPKPPIPPASDDVVNNIEDENPQEPVVESVIAEEAKPAPSAPTPPENGGPKMVTRNKSDETASPLSQVLSETVESMTPEAESVPPAPVKTPPPPPAQASPPPPPERPSSSLNFFLLIITIFSLVLAATGWGLYLTSQKGVSLSNLPTTFASPTPTPAAPTPTVPTTPTPGTKAATRIEVLNGSGVAGAAGRVADTLTNLGYTIARTGNADNQQYTRTQIFLSPQASSQLLTDLQTEYGTASKAGDLKDSTFSARIIVGKDWQP